MTILWDGTVLPCLMHGVADFGLMTLGRVPSNTLKELWNGPEASRYRQLHRAGRAHELEACNRCSFRALELEKMGISSPSGRTG